MSPRSTCPIAAWRACRILVRSDAFIWLDRGIYRPGETVQVMAMLRDAAGRPLDIPATVTVKRPNGQVFLRTTPPHAGDASVYLPVVLSSGASAGTWHVEINADPKAPPIGSTDFRVDAFVPDRMAVEAGPLPPLLIPGQAAQIPVSARFLYGAPAVRANRQSDASPGARSRSISRTGGLSYRSGG